jgi:magnesium transporter
LFRKQHPHVGARPGTLVIAHDALPSRVRLVQYDRERVDVEELDAIAQLSDRTSDGGITWIDVQGLGDEQTLHELAGLFHIHPLAMEDMVNTPQRPKSEVYGRQQLIIMRCVWMDRALELEIGQLSLWVGEGFVLSFQESHHDLLEPVRQRLQRRSARLRQHGADYLAYAIQDTIVDAYYPVLESLGDHLERLENAVIDTPCPRLLKRLNLIKNRLVNLRRVIWPQREAVRSLIHDDSPCFSDPVRMFLRDTYDHCIQTSEVVEMYREMATGLLNTYLSSIGHRTNEVMRTLTIMSSVFIPMTFLAGIYGMNFKNMPELQTNWGYAAVWTAMAAMALGMLGYFRLKGWIGKGRFAAELDLSPGSEIKSGASSIDGNTASSGKRRVVDINSHSEQASGEEDAPPSNPASEAQCRAAA